jgi:hypothetical protein
MSNPSLLPIPKYLNLAQASEIWLARKVERFRKPKTLECYRGYLKPLLAFFGDVRLRQIDAGSLVAYQTTRSKQVGPSSVNHELNILSQILRLAVCWGPISDSYSPLKDRDWQKPKTLTPQEQQLIFSKAKDHPELELAEIAFAIMRNTGTTSSELRRARLWDLDLESNPPTFHVGESPDGDTIPRMIPLMLMRRKRFVGLSRARIGLARSTESNAYSLTGSTVPSGIQPGPRPKDGYASKRQSYARQRASPN